MAESDESWRHHNEPWARLKWARQKKFGTAEDGAAAVGMKGHTYRAYERQPDSSKHIPLTYETAFHFANRFGVRWEWLMEGRGEPWREPGPLDKLIKRLNEIPPDRQEAVAEAIDALLRSLAA